MEYPSRTAFGQTAPVLSTLTASTSGMKQRVPFSEGMHDHETDRKLKQAKDSNDVGRSSINLILQFLVLLVLVVGFPIEPLHAGPEGRTRQFCGSAGEKRPCGGHLEPQCTSGPVCDAGINSYNGSPFPISIHCPTIFIADETVDEGCYDRRPNCGNCSGPGQVPCPEESADFCAVGCDAGLVSNGNTTLCESPGTEGTPCGPGFPCSAGLDCDLFTASCKAEATAKESCINPFVSCSEGLVCANGLECTNVPSRLGEMCSSVGGAAPLCGTGLYCKPGFPARCNAYRKPGQGCSVINPCIEGSSCEPCLSEECSAPLMCYPDVNALSEQQCRDLYAPSVNNTSASIQDALTFGFGNEIAVGVGNSREIGIAYSDQAGEFACYTTDCNGINIDVGVETFVNFGIYNDLDVVDGLSWVSFEEVQVPGGLINYTAAQVFGRESGSSLPTSEFIGTSAAFSVGIGPNPSPIAAGAYACETRMDTYAALSGQGGGYEPPSEGAEGELNEDGTLMAFGALRFDGDGQKLILRQTTLLDVTESLTLEAWISPESSLQDTSLLSKEGQYQIGLIQGELAYSIANEVPGWKWSRTGFHPPLFEWSHVALTYGVIDGKQEERVYVNGELVHQQAAAGAIGDFHPENIEFHIGGRQRTSTTFNGLIDEVRIWNISQSATQIKALMVNTPDLATSGLITNWRFQESDGNQLSDSSANALHITFGDADDPSAPGRVAENRIARGIALLFDGLDDHVSVSSRDGEDTLKVSSSLTLEAWVFPSGPGSSSSGGAIVSKEGEYLLGRGINGQLYFALANDDPGWLTVSSQVTLPQDRWNHVALTYSETRSEILLYLNGELAQTFTGTGLIGDAHPELEQLRIGGRERDDSGANQQFQGVIDEVRIWSVARSAEELRNNLDLELVNPPASLLGYWRFEETRVSYALDSSSNQLIADLGSRRGWQSPIHIDATALLGYPLSLVDCPTRDSNQCQEDKAESEQDGGGGSGGGVLFMLLVIFSGKIMLLKSNKNTSVAGSA